MKKEHGNIAYKAYPKHKIVDIEDINFNSKMEMESLLQGIICKFPGYSIAYPTFHNKEPDYRLVISVLKRLNFKLVYKKPVFSKKVNKINCRYALKYVPVKISKGKGLCCIMYKKALHNTSFASDYLPSLNPGYSFYFPHPTLNKNSKMNYFVILNSKIIGFFSLFVNKKRKFGYISYITLLRPYRNMGFSKDMLMKAESVLSKIRVGKWLESTDEANKAMIRAFEAYGFKRIRVLYGYVYNPQAGYRKFL